MGSFSLESLIWQQSPFCLNVGGCLLFAIVVVAFFGGIFVLNQKANIYISQNLEHNSEFKS